MELIKLLNLQQATNRLKFAQQQAKAERLDRRRQPSYQFVGKDADTNTAVISADGEDPIATGEIITNGHIKPGQSVNVRNGSGKVTVDQKPKPKQKKEKTVTSTATGKIKVLYQFPDGDNNYQLWVGGWKAEPVKVELDIEPSKLSSPYSGFYATLDNLGGDDWRINLMIIEADHVSIKYISPNGIERENEIKRSDLAGWQFGARCFGYEFWFFSATYGTTNKNYWVYQGDIIFSSVNDYNVQGIVSEVLLSPGDPLVKGASGGGSEQYFRRWCNKINADGNALGLFSEFTQAGAATSETPLWIADGELKESDINLAAKTTTDLIDPIDNQPFTIQDLFPSSSYLKPIRKAAFVDVFSDEWTAFGTQDLMPEKVLNRSVYRTYIWYKTAEQTPYNIALRRFNTNSEIIEEFQVPIHYPPIENNGNDSVFDDQAPYILGASYHP